MGRPRRIYVATSWRNEYQPGVVGILRAAGHEVYDFRHPATGGPPTSAGLDYGFSWSAVDPGWKEWDAATFRRRVLAHPLAKAGFEQDLAALEWCDTCVLVLPCGRSAHLEAGWARGAGKTLVILLAGAALEPELMYRWAHHLVLGRRELEEILAVDR